MAIAYGLATSTLADGSTVYISPGNQGRVYDVSMASGDTTGTIDLTVGGTPMSFTPSIVIITPWNITLSSAQVLAANGGAGIANAYPDGAGTTSQSVRVTSVTASAVAFAKGNSAAASFRCFVGRLYQTHN